MIHPSLILALLLTASFSLAAWLMPRHQAWAGSRTQAASLLEVLLGDSRRLFANHFFVKADVYFHAGHYPSIFDQAQAEEKLHLMEQEGHDHEHEQQEKASPPAEDYGFIGPPLDWLDRFGRHFFPSRHLHLEHAADEGELLPWLRIAASLDPHRIETYTVAAYWLRSKLGRVDAAQQFLREGWRANPDSYEILFELGRVQFENRHDASRARNLWELALKKWQVQEAGKSEPDRVAGEQLLAHLARLEESVGRGAEAIGYLEQLKRLSPIPDTIQRRIEELKKR